MPNMDYPGPCLSCIDSCGEVWDNQDYRTRDDSEDEEH